MLPRIYWCKISSLSFACTPLVSHSHARYPTSRQTVSRTAIRAEIDFDAEIKKLQTEAEERLDEKVEELMKNIDTVGQD